MPTKPYTVRELPWLKGSRRRTVGSHRYLHEAMHEAEQFSAEGRQVAVELRGVTLAIFLNGQKLD